MSAGPVLRKAADMLDALPHARVIRTDLHRALIRSAPSYAEAKSALEALADYLKPGDERWLSRWAFPRSRDEVSAELRAAAEQVMEVSA